MDFKRVWKIKQPFYLLVIVTLLFFLMGYRDVMKFSFQGERFTRALTQRQHCKEDNLFFFFSRQNSCVLSEAIILKVPAIHQFSAPNRSFRVTEGLSLSALLGERTGNTPSCNSQGSYTDKHIHTHTPG